MSRKIYVLDTDGEGNQIDAVAFTANPAIKTKGFAFSSQVGANLFFADEPKMRITAPLMKPAVIFRKDEETGEEYDVEMTAENIEKMFQKFMQNYQGGQKFNIDHDNEQMTNAYLFEAWIVEDPKNDKSAKMFETPLEKGTIMATAQFTDMDEFKERVASGQTGFSVEGNFGMTQKFSNQNQNEMVTDKGSALEEGKKYTFSNGMLILLSEDVKQEEEKEEEKEGEKEMLADDSVEQVKEGEPTKEEVPQSENNTYTKEEVEARIQEVVNTKIDEVLKAIAEKETEKVEMKKESEKEDQKFSEMPFHTRIAQLLNPKTNTNTK